MKKELTAAMIFRRQLLNKIIETVEQQEQTNKNSMSWADVGSVERQCDYMEKIIKELNHDDV